MSTTNINAPTILTINNESLYDTVQKALSYGLEGANKQNNTYAHKSLRVFIRMRDNVKSVTINFEKVNTSFTIYDSNGFLRHEVEYTLAILALMKQIETDIKEVEDSALDTIKEDFDITIPVDPPIDPPNEDPKTEGSNEETKN